MNGCRPGQWNVESLSRSLPLCAPVLEGVVGSGRGCGGEWVRVWWGVGEGMVESG